MINLLSYLNVIADWVGFYMFSPSIPIFSDDIRYQIVAARAKRYQVIFNRFVWYLSVTVRPVMNLQLEACTILIAQAAAIAIYCKAGFAFLSPCLRGDIRSIVHASPLKNKAPMSYLRLLLSRKWVVGRTSALYLRIKTTSFLDKSIIPQDAWSGTVRYGQVRSGGVRRGGVRYGKTRLGMVRFGMVCRGSVGQGEDAIILIARYGLVWLGDAG